MKRAAIKLTMLLAYWLAYSLNGQEAPLMLAMVGQTRVGGDDVLYRVGVEEAYGHDAVAAGGVLIALVNDALVHEVAQSFGVTVASEEIEHLSRHIDQTSRAPEILAKVKRVFGDDRVAYERLYLAPRIVNRKLRAFFSRNAEIHASQRALIEQAYSLARSGVPLAEAAQSCDLHYSTIEFGKGDNTLPALLEPYLPRGGVSSKGPLSAIVATMVEGEIHKDIIEDDRGYMVIRLVQRGGDQCTVQAITVSKRLFDAWFREQAAKIEIAILDGELRSSILSERPNVWWARRWLARPKIGDD